MLLTIPYVMFESKKNSILIARQKEGIDRTQKSFLAGEKSSARILPIFIAVDHPLCNVWKQKKTQILIAHQKEGIDRTQKSFLAGKKSTARV